MRAVVQRVLSAKVEVEGRIVSEIGPGLLVLVGLLETDCDSDADYICRKVLNMRLFPNEKTGKSWDQSVMQRNYAVLLDGIFGAMMQVHLVNDGPVTMQLDSGKSTDTNENNGTAAATDN
uniref:D-aminoacyl-tRNA deacylase n=1 Tax=Araucaria cunninghamii TaxID=56994 RepID=A0A0D6R9T5_ARACU